jgi:protein phosphatase
VLRAYGVTDKGRVRSTNEDCFAVHEALRLCVVADGLGGHQAGEVAARIAVDVVGEFIAEARTDAHGVGAFHPFGFEPSLSASGNLLRTAIQIAHTQILEAASTSGRYAGMGTTIVAALVVDDRLTVGHVGDSRLYVLAGRRLRQLTHDDSWMAAALARDPDVDPILLEHHPMRNALTNVVGTRPGTDVHVVEEQLHGGEVLLLSTDGVHGVLDERRLERLLQDDEDPADIAANVVRAALSRGSLDNCTAVVARYCPTGE